jgi:hypothetical protein
MDGVNSTEPLTSTIDLQKTYNLTIQNQMGGCDVVDNGYINTCEDCLIVDLAQIGFYNHQRYTSNSYAAYLYKLNSCKEKIKDNNII